MKRGALYLRVSTDEQTTENQRRELARLARRRGFRIVDVYDETISGVAKRRPQLEQLLADAKRRHFDVVMIWALDRLGRAMRETVARVLELDRLGVELVSYREPWLDVSGPVRELLISIFSWVAEQERTRLVERTRAGIERARAAGKKLGRPRKAFVRAELEQLVAGGAGPKRIARRLGCSRATASRLKKGVLAGVR